LADKSLFEQASSVAPVVNTSSTNSIFLFSSAETSVIENTFSTFENRSYRHHHQLH